MRWAAGNGLVVVLAVAAVLAIVVLVVGMTVDGGDQKAVTLGAGRRGHGTVSRRALRTQQVVRCLPFTGPLLRAAIGTSAVVTATSFSASASTRPRSVAASTSFR